MARSSSYETVALLGAPPVVAAARELNRAVWRLDWYARGLLNDADARGWWDVVSASRRRDG
jgi:hypothetical protein